MPGVHNLEKATFNSYLSQLFSLKTLHDSEVLLLQRLSLFPAIEISFTQLSDFLSVTDLPALDAELNALAQRGWLIKNQNTFKLHQIIKEFLLASNPIDYNACQDIVQTFAYKLDDAYTDNPIKGFEFIPFAVSITHHLSEKNKQIATLLSNISVIYRVMGELKPALAFGQKALTIKEAILEDQHPDLAISYNNLSAIYKNIGEREKALEYGQKALTIREAILGDQHPDLAISYVNMAQLHFQNANTLDAKKYINQALKIFKTTFPNGHPHLDIALAIKEDIYQKSSPKKLSIRSIFKSIISLIGNKT